MSCQVHFKRSAQKELSGLPGAVYRRAKQKILALAEEPRPHNAKKLVGSTEWRLRIGDWRIVYEIDDENRSIEIRPIAHRSKVYRE